MDDSRKRSLDPKTSSNISEPDSKKTAVDKAKEIAQKIAQNTNAFNNFSTASVSSEKSFDRKVFFPVDKFPGTNFVGLILGPKAQTLKELQQTLKVNLTIKGEGLAQKSNQQNIENINEPQHVYISATSAELADQAEEYIFQICNDPNKQEELKMRQKMLLNQSSVPTPQLQQNAFPMQQQAFPQQSFDNYSSYPQNYSNDIYSQQQQQQQVPVLNYNSQLQGQNQPQFVPQQQSYSASVPLGSNMTSKIVQVPQDLAGAVIGRGGDQIKQFQLHSNAHIQIDNSLEAQRQPVGTFRNVTISGTHEQVQKAEMLINNFIGQKTQALSSTSSNLSLTSNMAPGNIPNTNQTGALNYPCQMRIEVPNNKVGLIIGKQGKTVHRIQNGYRCKIDIPLGPDSDNPEVRTLTIGAYSENDLELCKNDIINVIAYQNMEMGQTGNFPNMNPMGQIGQLGQQQPMQQQAVQQQVAYSVEVPKDSVEYMSQYVASNIIQTKTGCSLEFNNCSIIVTGTQDKADLAIKEIASVVDMWEASKSSSGNNSNGSPGQAQGQAVQKYTRAQWQQWKEYYKGQGIEMDDEPPLELRADDYK